MVFKFSCRLVPVPRGDTSGVDIVLKLRFPLEYLSWPLAATGHPMIVHSRLLELASEVFYLLHFCDYGLHSTYYLLIKTEPQDAGIFDLSGDLVDISLW